MSWQALAQPWAGFLQQGEGLVAAPATAGFTSPDADTRRFHAALGLVVAVFVFLAFARNYWAPLAAGTLDEHPAVHVHALLYFAWTLLFAVQANLAARNRISPHRALGLFGIALAGAMLVTGLLATIVSLEHGLRMPRPVPPRTTAMLGFSAMLLFSTFVTLAIANLRRPDYHQRWMIMGTFALLQAVFARVMQLVPAIPAATRPWLGAILVDLALVAVISIDRRIRGRLHPAYLAGAAMLVTVQYGRMALLRTDFWTRATDWLASLAA